MSKIEIENHMVMDGEWSEDDERIIGECEECGEEIYSDNYYLRDGVGHLFCCKECAMDYYEIEEVND